MRFHRNKILIGLIILITLVAEYAESKSKPRDISHINYRGKLDVVYVGKEGHEYVAYLKNTTYPTYHFGYVGTKELFKGTYNFKLEAECEKVLTRVHVIGMFIPDTEYFCEIKQIF